MSTFAAHVVWVAPGGIIKAITHGDYITETNIRTVLAGNVLQLPQKKDIAGFDYHQPLLQAAPAVQAIAPAQPYTSCLLPYLPEVGSMQVLYETDNATHRVRTAFYNRTVLDLYLYLYGQFHFPRTHVLLQVADSSRYIWNESKANWHDWMAKNSYCYEGMLPAGMDTGIQRKRIHEDLDFYLGLHTRFEKRVMPCLLLKRKEGGRTAPGETGFILSTIVYELNQSWNGTPVFLDSDLPAEIKVPVQKEWLRSRQALEPALQAAGFELVPVQRTVEVLVITENNFINQSN